MKQQILAVDDSKAIRFLLQTVLGKSFQVITASDGCSAMHWLSKRNFPHLIIADPQLPDLENWELIQQLSFSGIYKNIPIMVLSGLGAAETEEKCSLYNVQNYFLKPFNPVDLTNAVQSLMKSKAFDLNYPMKAV